MAKLMNIFTLGIGKKTNRLFGYGISVDEAITRMDKISEIISFSKAGVAIRRLIESCIEISGYFVCIKLRTGKDEGTYLCIFYRITEKNKKTKKTSVGTFNLDSVDSQKIGDIVRETIVRYQQKLQQTG